MRCHLPFDDDALADLRHDTQESHQFIGTDGLPSSCCTRCGVGYKLAPYRQCEAESWLDDSDVEPSDGPIAGMVFGILLGTIAFIVAAIVVVAVGRSWGWWS